MVDGMSVSEAAAWIGVSPDSLTRVLDGREGNLSQAGITAGSRRLVPQEPMATSASCLRRSADPLRSERRELPAEPLPVGGWKPLGPYQESRDTSPGVSTLSH